MTYNIRYAAADPQHLWQDRLPLVRDLVLRAAPDVLGVQEALDAQLRDLDGALAQYSWVGQGRDGGREGEYGPIFYREDRLELVDSGEFWLSDTPDAIGSITWGNSLARMVTWALLRHRETGVQFFAYNTHFDYDPSAAGDEVRLKSARLLGERVAGAQHPVLVTGDFNDAAGASASYRELVENAGFHDAYNPQTQREPFVASFHDYEPPIADGERIDWILTSGAVTAESAQVVDNGGSARLASDHFAVLARLRLAA